MDEQNATQEVTATSELERAQELVQADMKKRAEEYNAILVEAGKRLRCSVQMGEKGLYVHAEI